MSSSKSAVFNNVNTWKPKIASFLGQNCFCDEICDHFNDCCWDYQHQKEPSASNLLPPKYVFSCLMIPEIKYGSPFLIVNKCPSNWNDSPVSKMCETPRLDNFMEQVYVTDNKTNVHFRNTYCALCNSVTDYLFWKPELMCKEDFHPDNASKTPSTRDCAFRFLPPWPNVTYRACNQYGIIDACRKANNSANMSVVSKCSNGGYAVVYGGMDAYKNIHCALCNGVDENILQCDPIKLGSSTFEFKKDKESLYSYRLLVDLDIAVGKRDGDFIEYKSRCSADELYDPFENQCRTIFCPEPFVPKSGKCIIIQDSPEEITPSLTDSFANQTYLYVSLKSGEFEVLPDKSLRVLSTGQVLNETDYLIDGNQTFVRADIFEQRNGYTPMFTNEEVTFTLTGGILSLSALLVNFVIYSCFRQLRNTPGKMLMSLIAALFVANFLFLVSSAFEIVSELCIAVAIAMHYFFLASFCWMNIMDFDLWWTFSRQFTVTTSDGKSSKRFYFYSAYAWTLPLLIVVTAVSVNFAKIDTNFRYWQPNYGADVCWIKNREAMIMFFIGPLLIFKLFDIVAFATTSVHIYRARKQSAMVQKKNSKCKFLIYIKLSLIMGLTWVFAFISNMAQIPFLWYVFIFLNTLQGVFICLCFVCTKKVFRLISKNAVTRQLSRRKKPVVLISINTSKSQSGKTLQTSLPESPHDSV
ncbi:hypothetical protein CHS0354_021104 [Potamilus streckersoni]|uniref:G-protein coupled receptors family 2 profile 2 domain-containing protein n=1 Tax=Potamilus streckersoni TaxID=2493646 RepID=A0AAE0VUK9_9BIVA|nr:hypothetical protein CHS0354_021104 [Potamilus streckersoni]